MTIRRANENDLQVILSYAAQIANQHHAYNPNRFSLLPHHAERLEEYFAAELASTHSIISLLLSNEDVVGFSSVKIEEENLEALATRRAWLTDICVDANARRSGGGKLLLDASKKAASELGTKILMLHVATANKVAENFFRKNEFEETMTELMFVAAD